MKAYAPNGLEIDGTLEIVRGRGAISKWTRDPDGTLVAEHGGETKMFWEEQRQVVDYGERVFLDTDGNEWRGCDIRLEGEPQEGAKPGSISAVRQFLDLSMEHLRPLSREALENGDFPSVVHQTEHGGFAYVPDPGVEQGWYELQKELALDSPCFPDLADCYRLARYLGCEYILFDREADSSTLLPTYDDDGNRVSEGEPWPDQPAPEAEKVTQGLILGPTHKAAVLAGLRALQGILKKNETMPSKVAADLVPILTANYTAEPITVEQIDALCEELNR